MNKMFEQFASNAKLCMQRTVNNVLDFYFKHCSNFMQQFFRFRDLIWRIRFGEGSTLILSAITVQAKLAIFIIRPSINNVKLNAHVKPTFCLSISKAISSQQLNRF